MDENNQKVPPIIQTVQAEVDALRRVGATRNNQDPRDTLQMNILAQQMFPTIIAGLDTLLPRSVQTENRVARCAFTQRETVMMSARLQRNAPHAQNPSSLHTQETQGYCKEVG